MINLDNSKPNEAVFGSVFNFLKGIASQIEEVQSDWEGEDEEIYHVLLELWDDVFDAIMYVVQPKLYGISYQEYAKRTGKVLNEVEKEEQQ